MSNYQTLVLCEDRNRAAELYTTYVAEFGTGGYAGTYRFMTDRVMFVNYLSTYFPQEHRYVRMVMLTAPAGETAADLNDWRRTRAAGYLVPRYRTSGVYSYDDSTHTDAETIDYIHGQAYAMRLDFREATDTLFIAVMGL